MGALSEIFTEGKYSSVNLSSEKELRDGKYWAPATIKGWNFRLPYVNMGTSDKTRAIPYFNPDKNTNEDLAIASALAMVNMFLETKPAILVTPDATRFTWFVLEALHRFHDQDYQEKNGINHMIELVRLPVITKEGDLLSDKAIRAASIHSYVSMGGQQRWLGAGQAGYEKVQEALGAGQTIAIADGIIASGATVQAMKSALDIDPNNHQLFTLSIARVGVEGPNYPPILGRRQYASIALSEVIEEIPAENLYTLGGMTSIPAAELK